MSTAVKTSVLARAPRGSAVVRGPGPIDRFLDAVWMERGLAPNTLAAYRADLTALDRWLEIHETELTSAKRGDLLEFMASRAQAGAQPRSTARQLSSFRRFYRYMLREGSLREDPTAQIAMPIHRKRLNWTSTTTPEPISAIRAERRPRLASNRCTIR
mgnify:CR=1 FL=1